MTTEKEKFSAFIDESGQDSKGSFFVVSIFIAKHETIPIGDILEKIEKESGKGNMKWHKSKYAFRKKYIEQISACSELKNKLFFEVFHDSKEYIHFTSFATARAILRRVGNKKQYLVSVFVDGFKKKEIEVFSRTLRDLHVRTRKIRGVKRDENSVFIRIADALCGLVRDANDGEEWANVILKKMRKNKIVTQL